MTDIALAPERVEALADVVFGFEEAVMTDCPSLRRRGFLDDWGTQKRLLVLPQICATSVPLTHTSSIWRIAWGCMYTSTVAGRSGDRADLIEAGVDILNISQPNLYDIPALAQRFRDQGLLHPAGELSDNLSVGHARRDLRRRAAVDGEL